MMARGGSLGPPSRLTDRPESGAPRISRKVADHLCAPSKIWPLSHLLVLTTNGAGSNLEKSLRKSITGGTRRCCPDSVPEFLRERIEDALGNRPRIAHKKKRPAMLVVVDCRGGCRSGSSRPPAREAGP